MEPGVVNGGLEIDEEPNLSVHGKLGNGKIETVTHLKVPIEEVPGRKKRKNLKILETEHVDGDEDDDTNPACLFIGNLLEKFWKFVADFAKERKLLVRGLVYIILALLYNAYFIASIYYSVHNGIAMDWCNGIGLLIIMTAMVYLGLFYFQVVKRFWGKPINRAILKPMGTSFDRMWKYR